MRFRFRGWMAALACVAAILGLSFFAAWITMPSTASACDPYRVTLGMPRADLVARCPAYEMINVTQNYEMISEQFVYPGGVYVYVENGAVTSMQWTTTP